MYKNEFQPKYFVDGGNFNLEKEKHIRKQKNILEPSYCVTPAANNFITTTRDAF